MITNEFTFTATVTFVTIDGRLILLIKKYCRARTRNFAHPAQVVYAPQTLRQNCRTQTGIHYDSGIQRTTLAG
jgi:hypothetical protein